MFYKKIYFYFFLLLTCSIFPQNTQVITFISPRSQGFNIPRIVSGWDTIAHLPDRENFYSTFGVAIETTSSFRPQRINQCLFGEDIIRQEKCNTEWKDFLIISGSQTENRSPHKDWLADYFGLPTDFRSIVRFRPRVNNVIVEAQSFFGFNALKKGLYAELFLPIVYTNWDLNIRECITDIGKNNYAPGYFSPQEVENENLLSSFSSYISGFATPTIDNLLFYPLTFGKMSLCALRSVHCAELRINLGYDHFIHNIHHIGGKIQLAAPLGNRPEACYLFEPIVGNQHHWELGLGLTAHARVWENIITNEKVDFFIDVIINHLFKAHQRRSFDLKNKPNSRYMLAEKMTPIIIDNLNGNGITPIGQFDQQVTSIVNLTTLDINVQVNIQADVALYCSYTYKNNYWTIGYNAWKRGCEDIGFRKKNEFPENTWAIKGDAQVYGFIGAQNSPTDLPIATPVALSATQSQATINYGTNVPKRGISSDETEQRAQIQNAIKNPNIDFPTPAFAGTQYLVASPHDTTISNQINTSIQPIFISFMDIDCNSARTSGFSHKLFTFYNHIINTHGKADAHIGLGSEIEFGRQAGPPPSIGNDKCINCALSNWGVFLKGSVCW